MKGLWKENVSSYNHKGIRRKKTTRKHNIKDNIKALVKINRKENYNKSIRLEGQFEVIQEYKNKKTEKIQVLLLTLNSSKKEVIGYFNKGKLYDYFNHNELKYSSFIIIKELDYFFIENKVKPRIRTYKRNGAYVVYNCVLNKKFWNIYGFYSSSLRKFFGNYSNRTKRRNVKKFIREGDFDKEIKGNSLDKSIEWTIW